MTTRVLIADDHPLTRDALAALLTANGFEVVALAEGGAEAIALAGELQPDLVVLDLTMPEVDGLTALPKVREAAPETAVVVLTAAEDDTNLLAAIRLGAAGYLLKNEPPSGSSSSCRGSPTARRRFRARSPGGSSSRCARAASSTASSPSRSPSASRRASSRCCCLLDQHLGTDEIAQRLFISEHTVRSHVKNLLAKLGVSSRRDALEKLAEARG